MSSEFLQEIQDNRFVMIMMQEHEYIKKLGEIVRSVKQDNNKICYVCLSKPYKDVIAELNQHGIDSSNFVFIDVLSSHYSRPEPVKNCIFLASPSDLDALKLAIMRVVEDRLCTVVLFDTISTLLIYQQIHSIVKFTHNLTVEKTQENVKKLFIILKDETYLQGGAGLVKDLEMFVDKKVEMNES